MWYKFSQEQKQLPFAEPEFKNKSEEEAMYAYYDILNRAETDVLYEFLGNPKGSQSWELVPASRLVKIWNDYAKYGFVRDERGIDDIADMMINNVARLEANTAYAGHRQGYPQEAPEDWDEKYSEDFVDYIEHNNQMRISDFGLKPLTELAIQLSMPQSAEKKLLIIDRMLNVIHPRSDMAANFVEGGKDTLDKLFFSTGYNPKHDVRL